MEGSLHYSPSLSPFSAASKHHTSHNTHSRYLLVCSSKCMCEEEQEKAFNLIFMSSTLNFFAHHAKARNFSHSSPSLSFACFSLVASFCVHVAFCLFERKLLQRSLCLWWCQMNAIGMNEIE